MFALIASCSVRRLLATIGVAVTLAVRLASAEENTPSLEEQLVEQAPKILKYFQDKDYRNVGVLKFQICKDGEPPSDHTGTLNMELADKLELALLVANRLQQPLGIIHAASAVAAKAPGANHLTEAGRKELFAGRYPLAWGAAQVKADAFLTGVAVVDDEYRKLNVTINVLDSQSLAMEKFVQFDAALDADDLAGAGESFVLRGGFDEDRPDAARADAAALAKQVRDQSGIFPLLDPAAPIELEILYNGRPQEIEVRHGKAFVREPRRRHEVTFAIRKRNTDDRTRYAVVLKINGENSIGRERSNDLACRKWTFAKELVLRGFQMTNDVAQEFRVMSLAESRANEMNYGPDVGTISLVVFRELGRKEPAPQAVIELPEDVAILKHGGLPAEPPANLDALKAQLQDMSTRGLIGVGEDITVRTISVDLTINPVPVMSAVVTYYKL